MTPARTREARDRESGVVAVVVALLIGVLFTFLSFVINIAHALDSRAQLLRASDSAALAGALELDGTLAGEARAKQVAVAYMKSHMVDRVDIQIDESDVVVGCWDRDEVTPGNKADAFATLGQARQLAGGLCRIRDANAVRVRNGRDDQPTHNPAMATFFSGFVGPQTMKVGSEAVAIGGGPCDGCSVPLVLASCQMLDSSGNLTACNGTFVFSDANIDSIGFTNLKQPASSDVGTRKIIEATECAAGQSAPCCKEINSGEIAVSNGNNLNCQVAQAMAQFIGQPISIPVVEVSSCDTSTVPPNPRFNNGGGYAQVRGFARVTIRAVCGEQGNGNGNGNGNTCNFVDANAVDSNGNPFVCPSGSRAIVLDVNCNFEDDTASTGCTSFGGLAPTPQIVR